MHQRMRAYPRIRSETLIYGRGTFGIRCVRSEYANIRRRTLCYTRPNYLFKIYRRMQAYRIYVTYTLTIRSAYAGYARHTLGIEVRYTHTL